MLLRMSSAADLATDLATEPPELFSKFQVTRFTASRSTRSSRHSGCSESAAPGPVMDALVHVDQPKGGGRKLPQPSVFFLFTLKLPEPHKQKLSPIGDVSHTLCQAAGLAPKVGRFRVALAQAHLLSWGLISIYAKPGQPQLPDVTLLSSDEFRKMIRPAGQAAPDPLPAPARPHH